MAIHIAAENRQVEVMNYILQNGGDINSVVSFNVYLIERDLIKKIFKFEDSKCKFLNNNLF